MPAKAHSDIHGRDIRTVKQCPPFVDAMAYGVMILLPCDVTVERGAFSWDWDIPEPATSGHPRAPLSFHVPAQFARRAVREGRAGRDEIQQFLDHRTRARLVAVRHPPGEPRRPAVSPDLGTGGRRSLSTTAASISRRCGREPDFSGVLPKGTPVAQCFAVPRTAPELVFESFDEAHKTAYSKTVAEVLATPGVYRKRFRARRGALNRLASGAARLRRATAGRAVPRSAPSRWCRTWPDAADRPPRRRAWRRRDRRLPAVRCRD